MFFGKSGNIILRRDDEFLCWDGVIDAMLPGKPPKLQIM